MNTKYMSGAYINYSSLITIDCVIDHIKPDAYMQVYANQNKI